MTALELVSELDRIILASTESFPELLDDVDDPVEAYRIAVNAVRMGVRDALERP